MPEANNEGAACLRSKALCAAFLCALMMTGCASSEEEWPSPYADLPSVTEYVSQAESFRSTESTSVTTSAAQTVSQSSADTETVTDDDAASSQTETELSAPAETSKTAPKITETEPVTAETTALTTAQVTETTPPPSTDVSTEIVTECSVPAVESPSSAVVTDAVLPEYQAEFFSNDLFIGDSISTGYSLYGFLSDKNVYAKVGLNPSTVLTKSIATCYGEIDVSTMLTYTNPKRVFIMLGSNGIQWLSVNNMLQSTDTLVKLIKEKCPNTAVMLVSVPPVTAGYDSTVPDIDVMAKVNEYNASLDKYCRENSMLYVDAASVLKDETGYFDAKFAESDGMHFKSSAYKTLLNKVQYDVTLFETKNPSVWVDPAETTAAQTEPEQTAQTEITEVPSETAAAETVPSETETSAVTEVSAATENINESEQNKLSS